MPRVPVLTAAAEPRPLGRGHVVVAGPVHALNALVPVDDLEDLTDEGTGLLGGILAQGGGQSVQGLSRAQDTPPPLNSERRLAGPHTHLWAPLNQLGGHSPSKLCGHPLGLELLNRVSSNSKSSALKNAPQISGGLIRPPEVSLK